MIPSTAEFEAPRPPKALRYSLWAVQIFLALGFAASGAAKATQPIDVLVRQMQMLWVPAVPVWLVRFTGVAELLGAAGLILPAATRIQPRLTALAGAGLVTLTLFAAAFHASRGETFMLPVTFLLSGLAAFVVWGRLSPARIPAR